jgi:hypothetical protein
MDKQVFAASNQSRYALLFDKMASSPKLCAAMHVDYREHGAKSKWNLNSVCTFGVVLYLI